MMKGVAPNVVAKWLALAYATATALFLLLGVDGPDVLLLALLSLPWIAGPVALAALGVKKARSRGTAWAFLGLEAGLAGSTCLLSAYLILIAPDAQNGFAMLTFPALQYGVVIASLAAAESFGRLKRGDGTATEQAGFPSFADNARND